LPLGLAARRVDVSHVKADRSTLKHIAELCAVETKSRDLSAGERRAHRQEKSRPILDELEPWLRTKLGLISRRTELACQGDLLNPVALGRADPLR
jgi:hypothetical protein